MHRRPSRLAAATWTVCALALFAVAQAQSDPSSTPPSTPSAASEWTSSAVTGTVVSVDPQANTVTLRSDAGTTQTFQTTGTTLMRASGKDILVSEIKFGDRVRVEPSPGSSADAPTRMATRLEIVGAGDVTGTVNTGTAQRTVSTDRPVLGERPDAGGDRESFPATAGSTTGRTVSTDRPVFGQKPADSQADRVAPVMGSTAPAEPVPVAPVPPSTYGSSSTTTATTTTGTTTGTTYAQTRTTSPPPAPSPVSPTTSADTEVDEDDQEVAELPATASPLPLLGLMGLLALAAGLAVRATRKQLS